MLRPFRAYVVAQYLLFHKHKIDGGDKADEGGEVVPPEGLATKHQSGQDGKDDERNDFLHHLELDERERSAIAFETYAVGRHLAHIFKQGNSPRKQYDHNQGPTGTYAGGSLR